MDTKGLVKKYIDEKIILADSKLTDDASFLGRGVLDSTGIFELAAFIEDTFGISVGDADLRPENFDSLNAIQSFVDRKLAGAGG